VLNENYKAVQAENYQLRDYIINLQSRLIESHGSYPEPPIEINLSNHSQAAPASEPPAMSSSAVSQLVSAAQATEARDGATTPAKHDGQYVPALHPLLFSVCKALRPGWQARLLSVLKSCRKLLSPCRLGSFFFLPWNEYGNLHAYCTHRRSAQSMKDLTSRMAIDGPARPPTTSFFATTLISGTA
jgi:hypothetical protein